MKFIDEYVNEDLNRPNSNHAACRDLAGKTVPYRSGMSVDDIESVYHKPNRFLDLDITFLEGVDGVGKSTKCREMNSDLQRTLANTINPILGYFSDYNILALNNNPLWVLDWVKRSEDRDLYEKGGKIIYSYFNGRYSFSKNFFNYTSIVWAMTSDILRLLTLQVPDEIREIKLDQTISLTCDRSILSALVYTHLSFDEVLATYKTWSPAKLFTECVKDSILTVCDIIHAACLQNVSLRDFCLNTTIGSYVPKEEELWEGGSEEDEDEEVEYDDKYFSIVNIIRSNLVMNELLTKTYAA